MKIFDSLAIPNIDDFLFGNCPHPITLKNGMCLGNGTVYPEINFTLPNMQINAETMPEVKDQYLQMITGVCNRAIELNAAGIVVEYELLPDLTIIPEWGSEICKLLRDVLDEKSAKSGMKVALRVTPNDIREFARPPLMRKSQFVDKMFKSFELCADSGADFLAIESTGGKEIHDEALLNCDLTLSAFALGVLASRDMVFLWDRIIEICKQHDVIPSSDSACGFANTAMVLAEQHYVPRVWAAIVRVMTIARSLIAIERGAIGPYKDCGYEGIFIKAIAGIPIALEGSEAACAHLSPIGNIARATADLWSNESVQNIKLLGGMAPTVSTEQLIYSTRLLNVALSKGKDSARLLRDWMVESDCFTDPQAYVLRPDIALEISGEIIKERNPYARTRKAAQIATAVLGKAIDNGLLKLPKNELRWLDKFKEQATHLPESEEVLIENIKGKLDKKKVDLSSYEMDW
jgi:methanol---5-hydroxybenzimidazolylcobamide Co-methyltransferase